MDAGPALLGILFGGGSVLGVGLKSGFDYLIVRRRETSADRRQKDNGAGALITRLEHRLDRTEQKADAAEARATKCERRHAQCEATVTVLMGAVNEARGKLNLPPISAEMNEASA